MFREVVRNKQRLTEEDCREILRTAKRGVLSVFGDDDYPYGMPLNHFYDEESGILYFHSGKTGHRTDSILRSDKASYCVMDDGVQAEGEWWKVFRSVIVFGRVRFVEDHDEAIEISRKLSYNFTSDEDYIQKEIDRSGAGVLVFALEPEHITGKRVNEK